MNIENIGMIELARGIGLVYIRDTKENKAFYTTNASYRPLATGTDEAKEARRYVVNRLVGFIRENRHGGPTGVKDDGTAMTKTEREGSGVAAIILASDGMVTAKLAASDAGQISVTAGMFDLKT